MRLALAALLATSLASCGVDDDTLTAAAPSPTSSPSTTTTTAAPSPPDMTPAIEAALVAEAFGPKPRPPAARVSRSTRTRSSSGSSGTPPVAEQVDSGTLQRRIGGCESSGRPDGPLLNIENRSGSTASGPWQILDSTWRGWRKDYGAGLGAEQYDRAMHAPVSIQATIVARVLAVTTSPWSPSRRCWA